MSDIKSPCVRNCCLDQKDICVGCGRTLKEILSWGDASDAEKKEILIRADKRKVERAIKFKDDAH